MSPQPGNFRRRAGGKNGNAFPTRAQAEIDRLRRAYLDNELPLREICRRFDMTDHELTVLRDRHGWPQRGKASRPAQPSHRRVQPKRRTEAKARDMNLYGEYLGDVTYLRWRGFVIDRHDIHPASQAVRVGNQIVTFAQLREKAERERRIEARAA